MDELWAKCLEGDKAAWDAFVDRYAPVIFAAARRLLHGRNLAGEDELVEDICQETFLRLLKNNRHLMRRYDPRAASPATYLTVIARSTALDVLRRKRLPTVAMEDAPPLVAAPSDTPAENPTAIVPEGLLTARQRLVLHLALDRQLDVPEIAALLGVSEQTVRSCRHKAIKRLRKYAAGEGGNRNLRP